VRRPEDGTVAYFISEFASEYIDKFAPPSAEIFSGVQESLKQLRQMNEVSLLQRTAHKYDIYAARAETRDERICATYLRKALDRLRARDFASARLEIAEAKRLFPTFGEIYRISGIIESEAGELFTASRELETSEQLDPNSPLVKYAFALFLIRFLHDYEAALQRIDAALLLDPHEFALDSARALVLTRLGRFKEAAQICEGLFERAGDRSFRRRIELADQTAECFRRWAEFDYRQGDADACEKHIARALKIISSAIEIKEFDEVLIRKLHKVLENGLLYASTSESLALAEVLVEGIKRNLLHLKASGIELRNWAHFQQTFSQTLPDINELSLSRKSSALTRENTSPDTKATPTLRAGPEDSAQKVEVQSGRILRLLLGFGFLEDHQGREWYFHRKDFNPYQEWDRLRRGQSVSFEVGKNDRGACAVRVRLSE
jgi:LuxR family glucitol operon transcriptional activator